MVIITHSPEETEICGAQIASLMPNVPVFIALYGDMGAGKTAFVRGFAKALSPGSRVKSPTYTIVNEYRRGKLPVFHFDLYRLTSYEELDSFGFDEYLSSGYCIAEWPDILGDDLPEGTVTVHIRRLDEDTREISVDGIGEDPPDQEKSSGTDCAAN